MNETKRRAIQEMDVIQLAGFAKLLGTQSDDTSLVLSGNALNAMLMHEAGLARALAAIRADIDSHARGVRDLLFQAVDEVTP